MWTLTSISYGSCAVDRFYNCDGKPLFNYTRGGLNSPKSRIMISGFGYIDILDNVTLNETKSEYEGLMIVVNGLSICYEVEASISFVVNEDGSFALTVNDSPYSGSVHRLPKLEGKTVNAFDQMISKGIVPYLDPPPPCVQKTTKELQALAAANFPSDPLGFQKAMSLYDWTSASFIRQDLFNQLQYTSLDGHPLDLKTMARVIWGCNYPGYTHEDANFMNMFGLTPPSNEASLYQSLQRIWPDLKPLAIAEMLIYTQAILDLPWPTVKEYPKLYRGAMSMSGGYNTSDFSPSMFEFPGNAGPIDQPLVQSLDDALKGILAPGSIITTKGPWSFSNDKAGAEVWQNGILVTLNPPQGATHWPGCADITTFSINPGTFEIDMPPPCRYHVDSYEWITIKEKPVCHITMTLLGYCAEPMID
ncbi:MAG: hypothetical protein AAF065_05240 [Verrucomicrobiota bacterium]